MSDVDTAAADSLKVLDPERPIREVDIGFAIGSIVRLQVCRESAWRTAGRWESSPGSCPGTQTYVGQLQSGLFLRAYFAYTASHVRLCAGFRTPAMTIVCAR